MECFDADIDSFYCIHNPKDTDEFARRLELMLYDEPMRQLWLDWSNESIGQYDFKRVIDQYEAVYKKAVKRKKAK